MTVDFISCQCSYIEGRLYSIYRWSWYCKFCIITLLRYLIIPNCTPWSWGRLKHILHCEILIIRILRHEHKHSIKITIRYFHIPAWHSESQRNVVKFIYCSSTPYVLCTQNFRCIMYSTYRTLDIIADNRIRYYQWSCN